MEALIEIIIEDIKKFGGEIIGGILLAVALWVFPGLRKIFSKKDESGEEMRKIVEEALKNSAPEEIQKQLELKRKEEERLKQELRQHEEALKAKKAEEARLRDKIQRQREEQRKSSAPSDTDKAHGELWNAVVLGIIFVFALFAFVGMWSLIQRGGDIYSNENTGISNSQKISSNNNINEETIQVFIYWGINSRDISVIEFTTTIKELTQSAEDGNPESQYILGRVYEGRHSVFRENDEEVYSSNVDVYESVKQDKAKAVKWYRKSAQQGYSEAQKILKQLGEKW